MWPATVSDEGVCCCDTEGRTTTYHPPYFAQLKDNGIIITYTKKCYRVWSCALTAKGQTIIVMGNSMQFYVHLRPTHHTLIYSVISMIICKVSEHYLFRSVTFLWSTIKKSFILSGARYCHPFNIRINTGQMLTKTNLSNFRSLGIWMVNLDCNRRSFEDKE